MQTCHLSKIIFNFYSLISLLLPSLKHGLAVLHVIFIPWHNTILLSSIVAINVVVEWEYFWRNHLNYYERNDLNVFNES